MIAVVPYKPEHLTSMVLQPDQAYLRAFITPEVASAVAAHEAFSALDEDGDVLGSAGVIKLWEGRGMAWAYLSVNARNYMLPITKAVRRFLAICPLRRVEMTVDAEFAEGHRWANMLGFKLECGRMRAYRPDGGACSLYAMVRQ
jgi:hypothetical protein